MTGQSIPVYLEIGQKRVFAGALDWPGWSRSGRDEAAALAALFDYGPRYARVLSGAQFAFSPPSAASDLVVVERLTGSATTDFGAPEAIPSRDRRPLDPAGLRRLAALLQASWEAYDDAAAAAAGAELRKGPRGGGRELEAITRHVLGAEGAYLGRLAQKPPKGGAENLSEELRKTRQVVLEALEAAARGEIPERGPRGGAIWPARYFIRRVAWHALDHAWEIEDRLG